MKITNHGKAKVRTQLFRAAIEQIVVASIGKQLRDLSEHDLTQEPFTEVEKRLNESYDDMTSQATVLTAIALCTNRMGECEATDDELFAFMEKNAELIRKVLCRAMPTEALAGVLKKAMPERADDIAKAYALLPEARALFAREQEDGAVKKISRARRRLIPIRREENRPAPEPFVESAIKAARREMSRTTGEERLLEELADRGLLRADEV